VPIVTVQNLARGLEELRERGYLRVGLDSEAPENLDTVPMSRPLALVMGAEGKGLRQKTREFCDVLARMDMPGVIKSLNVSNATAIALYAASRATKA
jgi:23S rRNA (guanosine2251-2'-O)-methyltransferase